MRFDIFYDIAGHESEVTNVLFDLRGAYFIVQFIEPFSGFRLSFPSVERSARFASTISAPDNHLFIINGIVSIGSCRSIIDWDNGFASGTFQSCKYGGFFSKITCE